MNHVCSLESGSLYYTWLLKTVVITWPREYKVASPHVSVWGRSLLTFRDPSPMHIRREYGVQSRDLSAVLEEHHDTTLRVYEDRANASAE